MSFAFRCPETGLPHIGDKGLNICPSCGQEHEAYEAGVPPRSEGAPNVIGDHIAKHFDWGAGVEINSRSERNKIYKEKGLRLKSISEHRQQHGGFEKPAPTMSYRGQKDRTTKSEGARTHTGQKVI